MYRIAVTNRHLCQKDFLLRIQQIASGTKYSAIVLREKDLSEDEYEDLAKKVIQICLLYNKKCILHTYVDVAIRLQHPYIHLPVPVLADMSDLQKKYFMEIGSSVHSVEQAIEAKRLGATYLTAGHIFATDCKKGLPPRGLDFLQQVCEAVSIPVYGIGGIDDSNENQIIEKGAKGVCIMSGCMVELRLR